MKLSIIIPCYNCSETLREAVDSVFRQDLDDFEIVLVEDCSTDHTREVIKEIKNKYPEIHDFYNEKNLGGGATRNIAVSKTTGEYIFCLDSDDILGDGTLNKMLKLAIEKNCDGVGIHKSIKFNGKNIDDVVRTDIFGFVNGKIPFDALIEKNGNPICSLYSTFMFSRNAFKISGGYPENHGFDTQGFAWRFLMNGLTAYTCEGAVYYHRINFHQSYYIREYRQGKTNLNWIKIFTEFISRFSERTLDIILNYDINSNESIISVLQKEDVVFEFDLESIDQEMINYYKKIFHIVNNNLSNKISLDSRYFLPNYIKVVDGVPRYVSPKVNSIFRRIVNKIKRIFKYFINKYKGLFHHIKSRGLNLIFIISLFKTKLDKFRKVNFDISSDNVSEIDIVIPTITKDFDTLRTVTTQLKKNLQNKIKNIYIVSINKDEVINFCKENGFIFVNENDVLNYSKQKIDYKVSEIDRSGWLFQQLIKLNADSFVECDDYLVIDSDTVLINKHNFKDECGRYIFQMSEEWHVPYRKTFEKIFGYNPISKLSFVSHMMIFNKKILGEMKSELEKIHNKKWDEVIIENIDNSEMSYFSEFETYGNFIKENYPEFIKQVPFYNLSIDKGRIVDFENLSNQFKEKYNSISFHDYSN